MIRDPDVQALIESQARLTAQLDRFLQRNPEREFTHGEGDVGSQVLRKSARKLKCQRFPMETTTVVSGLIFTAGLDISSVLIEWWNCVAVVNSGINTAFQASPMEILFGDNDNFRDPDSRVVIHPVQAPAIISQSLGTGQFTAQNQMIYSREFFTKKRWLKISLLDARSGKPVTGTLGSVTYVPDLYVTFFGE